MKQESKKQNRQKIQKKKKKYLVQQAQKFQSIIEDVGNYQIYMSEVIGQGTYGKVYRAYQKNDVQKKNTYACKVIKKQKLDNLQLYNKQYAKQLNDRLKRQGEFQLSLQKCPYIARMYQTSQNQKAYYYIMEYCETDLSKLLKKKRFLELEPALKYFCQILQGIKFIYQKNAFHRDLKPQNLLIKDDTIKISDFGFVKIFTQIDKQCRSGRNKFRTQSKVGTFRYMSPDILNLLLCESQTEGSSELDYLPQKSDVWSLGIILYKMLYGKQPYDGKDQNQMLKKIYQNQLQFPDLIQPSPPVYFNIPDKLIKLIKKMIHKDPVQRITFLQLYKQINSIYKKISNQQKKGNPQPQKQQKIKQKNKTTKQRLLNGYQKMIELIDYDCINYATIRQIGIPQYVEFSYKLITLIHEKRMSFAQDPEIDPQIRSQIQNYQKRFYHQIKAQCNLQNNEKLSTLLIKIYYSLAVYQDYDQLQRNVQIYLLFLLQLLSYQIHIIDEEYLLVLFKREKQKNLKQKKIDQYKRDAMQKIQKYLNDQSKQKQKKTDKANQKPKQKLNSKSKSKTKQKDRERQKYKKQKELKITIQQGHTQQTLVEVQQKQKNSKRQKSKKKRQLSSKKQDN